MALFKHFFKHIEGLSFIQIGANDGVRSDFLNKYIKKYHWRGVLVEPLADELEKCRKEYAGCGGLEFENVAIAEKAGEREMYVIPEQTVSSAFAPVWRSISNAVAEGRTKRVVVPCITFMDLCEKYDIAKLDVLVIDTEGYDYHILKTIDFGRIKPTVIVYEYKDKHSKVPYAQECLELLAVRGYRFRGFKQNMVAYQ